MAVFRIKSSDVLLRFGWYDALNSIQSFDWSPTFNEEFFQELGNDGYAAISIEPELSGTLEFTGTGSTVAFLRRMIADYDDVSGEFLGFLAGDPDAANHNVGTIDSNQLEYAIFDLIEAKKANENFDRSTVIPRASLATLSFTADAAGTASETYTFEGEPVHLFRAPWHDAISIPLTRDAGSETVLAVPDVPGTANPYAIEVTGGAAMDDADWVLAYIYIDDVEIEATGANVQADWTLDTFDGTLTLLNHTAPLGARITAVIYRKTPGDMPTLATPPSNARFVRANSIDLFLVRKADIDLWAQADLNAAPVTAALTDDKVFLRVQSMDMNIDLRREALRQIRKAKSSVFYRAATYPLQITASATLMESDLADFALLQDKQLAGTEVGDTLEFDKILNIIDFEGQEWQIVARYYKDDTVVQTMALCDARVSGMSSRVAVEGNVEVTWNFTGSLWKVSGSVAA